MTLTQSPTRPAPDRQFSSWTITLNGVVNSHVSTIAYVGGIGGEFERGRLREALVGRVPADQFVVPQWADT